MTHHVMTPEEIVTTRKRITQEEANDIITYLNGWMIISGQPDKRLLNIGEEMKKDGCEPHIQVKQVLSTVLDWFAYGN